MKRYVSDRKTLADALNAAKPGDVLYWGSPPKKEEEMTKLTDNFHEYATQYRNKPEPQWRDHPYNAKKYTGRFSVQGTDNPFTTQYKNKPEPMKPDPRYGPEGQHSRYPPTGRHYTTIIMDDLVDEPPSPDLYTSQQLYKEWQRLQSNIKEVKMSENSKDFEYQNLYEVTTTYGGDRNDVIVKRTDVVAESENRALMQSKDDIEDDWDMDYVDQNVDMLCTVRVKLKPRETKEVVK